MHTATTKRISIALVILISISLLGQSVLLAQQTKTASPASAKSAANFKTIMSNLEPNGDVLVVLNTEDMFKELFEYITTMVEAAPAPPTEKAKILQTAKRVQAFLEKNGFFSMKGFGFSVVPLNSTYNSSRIFIARDARTINSGLWRGLVGGAPKECKGLKYVPRDTVFLKSTTGDVSAMLKMYRGLLNEVMGPSEAAKVNQIIDSQMQALGTSLDKLIAGMGSEAFIALMLSETQKVPVPGGDPAQPMQVPLPSILIGVEVKDQTIENILKSRLGNPQQPVKTSKIGTDTITFAPQAIPLPMPLQPAFATKDGILLIANSPSVLAQALKASTDKTKHISASSEFATLMKNLPAKNNGSSFISKRLTDEIAAVQKQMMAQSSAAGGPQPKAMVTFVEKLQSLQRPVYGASVTLNYQQGVLIRGITTAGGKEIVQSMAVAPVGLLAAIAIPSFVKARGTAQRNACVNNMRMLDSAAEQWALANRKTSQDVIVTKEILTYLRGGVMPKCPQGGTYSRRTLDDDIRCSVHGTMNEALHRPPSPGRQRTSQPAQRMPTQ